MVYLTRKLDQKSIILTFGQFDHLIILTSRFEHVQFNLWFFDYHKKKIN
jgi:hypothetical protein